MPFGPAYFEGFGFCIYCGDAIGPLTDEHVMPTSLGGAQVIRAASCAKCSAITSRFEGDVARGMWKDIRYANAGPGNRKRRGKRPATVTMPSADGSPGITIPYSDYPAPAVFYRMGQAGILAGLPASLDTSGGWLLEAYGTGAAANQFETKHGTPLIVRFRHMPQSFGRMLAKIGYCQALTEFRPEEFDRICLPYILGTDANVSHIVGGTLGTAPPAEDVGYRMETQCVGTISHMWLVSSVRIFANLGTPVYHVVVGAIRGREAVEAAAEKHGSLNPL